MVVMSRARGILRLLWLLLFCLDWIDWIHGQRRVKLDKAQAEIVCSGVSYYDDSYFRLPSKSGNCRDVVSCSPGTAVALRCPSGLAFDIQKQVCQWEDRVPNCGQLRKRLKSDDDKNLAASPSSKKCSDRGLLSCDDGITCIPQLRFCDERVDCPNDNADEKYCSSDRDPNRAPDCEALKKCHLPDCYCYADPSLIPGNLKKEDTPQMITITMEDALNPEHGPIIDKIFKNRDEENDDNTKPLVNPNNCTIKGTFFVSHEYSSYSYLNKLRREGNEIAVHSITHNSSRDYWDSLSPDAWNKEMNGMKNFIRKFSKIDDVAGARVPLLKVGGNRYFTQLHRSKFLYDSSMISPSSSSFPRWPYTLDAQINHPCHGYSVRCPTRAFPGLWEIPINELKTPNNKSSCVFLQLCRDINSPQKFFRTLHHNFLRHFRTNRAPFGIHLNPSWFKSEPELLDVLNAWIRRILKKFPKIVYFVTNRELLEWIRHPTPIHDLHKFEPWLKECQINRNFPPCYSKSCNLDFLRKGGERRFDSCLNRCPSIYPWI